MLTLLKTCWWRLAKKPRLVLFAKWDITNHFSKFKACLRLLFGEVRHLFAYFFDSFPSSFEETDVAVASGAHGGYVMFRYTSACLWKSEHSWITRILIIGANDQVLNPHFTELFELGASELNFKRSRFTVTPPRLLACQSYYHVHGVQTPNQVWTYHRTQLPGPALNMIKAAFDFHWVTLDQVTYQCLFLSGTADKYANLYGILIVKHIQY